MSLPNYLSKIKSSGIYRFVFDKSLVPQQEAETLRLMVGYSEKGPFNTPVYIESSDDFIKIFGNINKRLERKGVYFHRLCLQALSAGPILALNLKPFNNENVQYSIFDTLDLFGEKELTTKEISVKNLYDTDRFWSLDFDKLPTKVNNTDKFITVSSTDTKDLSCTVFLRKSEDAQYDLTIREWFANNTDEEMPEYLEKIADDNLKDYFLDVYVFKGQFTKEICKAGGPFGWSDGETWHGYFKTTGDTPVLNNEYKNIFDELEDPLEALASNTSSNYIAKYQGCTIPYFKDGNGNYVALDVLFNNDQTSHKMMMKLNEDLLFDKDASGLRKCMSTNTGAPAGGDYVGPVVKPTTSLADVKKNSTAKASAEDVEIEAVAPSTYKMVYLKGFDYKSLEGKKDSQYIKAILDVTKNDAGVREGLTNRVSVDYHYLVDTFKSFGGANCKVQLSTIAKYKDNAFAILNYPAHVDESSTTTLPTDEFGASWAGYFTPVIFSDGAIKYTVPSAALVSNNFMDKWGARQPYYIVAGPTYGKLNYQNLVGPDFNYSRKDLDVLEPKGVNAIVYVPRKGTYINSNQTAKQNPVTALSKIHVRELVIYLQDSIESMLQNYQWELNTQALRDTIKSKADTILENVMNNGGVYAFTNVCDETNNTPEVIDNEMIILDTAIEPARGAGKMVQRLTIHKTGGITSSNI